MVLERIRQAYPQLTKSQRKLADFIANSYQEAAFLTASRLALRVNVNEATVIRFAKRLGYSGYPDLNHDVQVVVQEELQKQGAAGAGPAAEEPFLTVLKKEIENLQRSTSHVSPEVAHRLMVLLRGTRRVYAVGQGVSYYLAGVLASGLAGLGLDARVAGGDAQSLALALADLENTDALVGITAGQESVEIARAIRAARERGARTLAVATSPLSGSAQAAELALICATSDLLPVRSVAVMATYLDAIVQALAGFDLEGAKRFGEMVLGAERSLRGR